MFDIKVAHIFLNRIITYLRCGFFFYLNQFDASLFWIQFWADQCWHTIKPRRIQCRLSSTTEFKFSLLTAESNNGGTKTVRKCWRIDFFSFTALFPVHLVDAICSSFTKWTLIVFGMRMYTDKWQHTLTYDGSDWQCRRKLKHLFAHSKRNVIQSRQSGVARYRFMRSVYTIAFAKQLKMNFSIILFGDCVNARRTQLTPSTMRKRQCIHTKKKKREMKLRMKRGNERPHANKKRENVAKECYNLIGLNIYKLCCHVQRIMGLCVCAVILMMATEHIFPIWLSVRRFRFH